MTRALGGAALVVVATVAACGPRDNPRAGKGVVRFVCEQRDVGIWIDDRYIGEIEAYRAGVALRAGAHRFKFRHDGSFPRYFDVTVRAGETVRLEVDLAALVP